MSFPAYPAYQDSGVEWLGQIPAAWNQVPFWALFRRVKRSGYSDEQLLSVYRDYGVVRKADRDDNFNKPSEDLSAYQLVEEGDLAINKMKAWQGSVGISEHRGIVSPAYFVYRSLHTQDNRFLHYLLRSAEYTAGYLSLSKGIRVNQWDLDPAYHSRMPVALPSLDEQVAIAAFLDRETGKIDALVEEQLRLIALLKEKRQAVISYAVTKGLDPHAPMKDSGIEWLGEVPAHWEVSRLKRCIQTSTSGPRGWSDLLGSEGGIFFQSQNIGTDMRVVLDGAARIAPPAGPDKERSALRMGDVVVCITGGRTGAVAYVDDLPDETFVNQHVCLVRPHPQYVSGLFLSFVLFSEIGQKQLALAMYGLKQGLSLGDIRDLVVPIPSLQEQEQIASLIASQFADFAALEAEALNAVALLSERRAALISAAVTGKINVCQSATVIPFPFDRARARRFVATEIIERLAHQPTFGRTELQKVAYLAEAHANITELAGCYIRMPFGPLDQPMMDEIEAIGSDYGIAIDDKRDGSMVRYRVTGTKGSHTADLRNWLGEERFTKLDHLIKVLSGLKTHSAEAIATLYAVWNDALIEGRSLTDDQIFSAFFSWHPKKGKNFRIEELPHWLDWMRRHGIVPTGSGSKTMNQIGTLL